MAVVALTTAWSLAACAQGRAQIPGTDPIAEGFRNVPRDARLHMFWRVFGPAWTPAEIDYQLEELGRAGVGGVMICFTYPVALNDPARGLQNHAFLSPEFLDTLRYAAEKARRLGLEFSVCGGTGWPFGGPSVTLHDAAQRLRAEPLLPLADGRGCALPMLREGERYLAAFCGSRDVTAFIRGDRLEIPDAMWMPEPALGRRGPAIDPGKPPERKPPAGVRRLPACRIFITGPTYMTVKRPSLGGEGYVLDHYRADAARGYLDAVVAPMLRAAPDGLIRTIFCDSLEVYHANWTHDFAAQFQRRRGYDLIPHLPELFDESSPTSQDLRFDYWRTAAELAEQEFARTVHTWCGRHHVRFALEPYGTPPMGLTAARCCDQPWGEQYEWKGFSFSRLAASSGHLAGKRIIGAEAWTWTGIPNRLADSLSDLKLCSDLHFLSGENELTGVDFPYSPRSAGVPGWLPYFGPVMNQNNPQWFCFPELVQYVNRCQWLLRQGKPVADVALYTPAEDAFANGPMDQMLLDFQLRDRLASGELTDEFGLDKALRHHSDVIYSLLSGGYNFDGIDFFAVNELARVQGQRLVVGDGRYAIIVLPHLDGMELGALEKIARYCRAGGVVIATRRLPSRAYGWPAERRTERLQAVLGEMFGPGTGTAFSVHGYGRGRAIFTPDEQEGLAAALGRSGVEPDMRVSPFQPEISHVHRSARGRDFYFVVNVGAKEARFTADFRVGNKAVSLWDPLHGEITPLPTLAQDGQHTRVALALPPRGSMFVCFSSDRHPLPTEDREGGRSASRPPDRAAPSTTESHPLDIGWHVAFDGPDAPPPREIRGLTSWTDWPGAQFFSGRATYTGMFECSAPLPAHAWLRFDQVREVAEIVINGRRAGAVWTPPYELEITPFLKQGPNTLEITVANLPVNRFLGLPDLDLRPLRAVYGERFPAPEEKKLMSEPVPSGLIGSVMLLVGDPTRSRSR